MKMKQNSITRISIFLIILIALCNLPSAIPGLNVVIAVLSALTYMAYDWFKTTRNIKLNFYEPIIISTIVGLLGCSQYVISSVGSFLELFLKPSEGNIIIILFLTVAVAFLLSDLIIRLIKLIIALKNNSLDKSIQKKELRLIFLMALIFLCLWGYNKVGPISSNPFISTAYKSLSKSDKIYIEDWRNAQVKKHNCDFSHPVVNPKTNSVVDLKNTNTTKVTFKTNNVVSASGVINVYIDEKSKKVIGIDKRKGN